jgi:hypothetical protein
MAVVVGVVWLAKLGAVGMGLAVVLLGVLIVHFGDAITTVLNKSYKRLPGKFQYPAWYSGVFGRIVIGFGVLVAVAGGALAGR